ncbi:MAG: FecR domain-containing protein [Phycisphaerales bacterium]
MISRSMDRSPHSARSPLAASASRHLARASALATGPLALAVIAGSAWAWQPDQPAAQPSTPAPAADAVDQTATETPIFIVGLKGNVGYKAEGETKYTPAKAGAVLRMGYEIATAANSMVQIQVGAGQRFTIDRVTKVIITEAIAKPGLEQTVIDLPYGRVNFDVTSARLANDVKIMAPDATLAISGTEGGMEVCAGRPTRSYGGTLNKGRIDVRNRAGTLATLTGNEETDVDNPNPALNSFSDGFVEINDGNARTGDEFAFVFSFPTVFQLVFGNITDPGVGVPPPVSGNFTVNLQAHFGSFDPIPLGAIVTVNPITTPRLVSTPGPTDANLNAFTVGEAITQTAGSSAPEFLRLERTGAGMGATLRSLTLDGMDTTFTTIATFTGPSSHLRGLGQVDRQLYSINQFAGKDTVVRLNPAGAASTVTPIADFGGARLESIDGITERGTLILGGRLPGSMENFDPFGTRASGVAGPDALVLEYDPRTHFLRSAASDLQDDFNGSNAAVGGGLDSLPELDPSLIYFDQGMGLGFANSIPDATFIGTSYSNGFITNGVGVFVPGDTLTLHVVATIDSTNNLFLASNPGINESRYYITLQPGSATAPDVVREMGTDPLLRDLTSERGPTSAPPGALGGVTGLIDLTLDPLFATLGYSMNVVTSGVAEALLRSAILQVALGATAGDPDFGTLAPFLTQFAGQQSGFGQASYAFRTSLDPMSPLFLTPAVVGGTLMGPTFFFINAADGRLIERDLFGNQVNALNFVYGGPTVDLPIFGSAIWSGGAGNNGKFFLATEVSFNGGSFFTTHISQFNLNQNPGGTIQPPLSFASLVPSVDNTDPMNPILLDSYTFSGLGTLGNDVYASGIRAGDLVPDFTANGIFRVPPGATTTTNAPEMRFFFPGDETATLAGAPSRGSLFVGIGLLDNLTGQEAPSNTMFGALDDQIALLELDPRNQFVRSAYQAANGDFAPLTGSGVTNGTMVVGGTLAQIGTIDEVIGMAYVGNKLILSGFTANGQSVIITYNPDANNTSDARLERVEFLAPGSPLVTELASEPVGIAPAGQFTLLPPAITMIDPDINPVFRNMAYSTQAAASGVIRNLVAEQIVARAMNPAACRNSGELQSATLDSIVSTLANQQMGAGQAVQAFRNSLPPGHPCLPGAGSLAP